MPYVGGTTTTQPGPILGPIMPNAYTPPQPLPGPIGGSTSGGLIGTIGGAVNGGVDAYFNSAAVAAAMKGIWGGGKAGAAAATAAADAGAAAGAARGGIIAGTKGVIGGIANVGKAMFKGTWLAAAIGGGVSVLKNGMAMMKGQQSMGRTVGNVVADTGTAIISGAAAAGAGGLATLALGALGVTGGLIPIGISVLAGAAGYLGVDALLGKTGVKQMISDTVSGIFGGG